MVTWLGILKNALPRAEAPSLPNPDFIRVHDRLLVAPLQVVPIQGDTQKVPIAQIDGQLNLSTQMYRMTRPPQVAHRKYPSGQLLHPRHRKDGPISQNFAAAEMNFIL
ncbi:MAG: hypothetical protein CL759_09295 [Chloroflexi bacterium]|nr:hypothetical protein [Chloroflexota bacterium]